MGFGSFYGLGHWTVVNPMLIVAGVALAVYGFVAEKKTT